MILEKIENIIGKAMDDFDWKMSPDLSRKSFYSRFNYAIIDDEDIIVHMGKGNFNMFEYYLGMEYDRDCIKMKLELERDIYVAYSNSNRLMDLLDIEDDE